MKNFKHFLFFVAAATLSLGFVGCSDDSDDFNDEGKTFAYSTIEVVCDYTGAYYELVDLNLDVDFTSNLADAKYSVNDNKKDQMTITFTKMAANAATRIKLTGTRNETAIDASKTYSRSEIYQIKVTRHFTDGTTGQGGNMTFKHGLSGIDKDKMEEYITKFGTTDFTCNLDGEGNLIN